MIKWLCIDEQGNEYMHSNKIDIHNKNHWYKDYVNIGECVQVPKGTIEKLLGYRLHHECLPATYSDEPSDFNP